MKHIQNKTQINICPFCFVLFFIGGGGGCQFVAVVVKSLLFEAPRLDYVFSGKPILLGQQRTKTLDSCPLGIGAISIFLYVDVFVCSCYYIYF